MQSIAKEDKAIFHDTSAVLLALATPFNWKLWKERENGKIVPLSLASKERRSDSGGRINHERGNFKRATAQMRRTSIISGGKFATNERDKLFASLAYVCLNVCTEMEALMLVSHGIDQFKISFNLPRKAFNWSPPQPLPLCSAVRFMTCLMVWRFQRQWGIRA